RRRRTAAAARSRRRGRGAAFRAAGAPAGFLALRPRDAAVQECASRHSSRRAAVKTVCACCEQLALAHAAVRGGRDQTCKLVLGASLVLPPA
ncbi:unnamed protein product, partial [Pelagomonas calceolata]